MEHLIKTLQAAKDYKELATNLVGNLCSISDIDFKSPERNHFLRKKYGKQIEVSLDKKWTFCLHGSECRFYNNLTRELVEVIMVNGENCGVIDNYFFFKYCETSNEHSDLAEFYNNDLNKLASVLNELYKMGHLKKENPDELELNRNLSA